MSSVSALYLVLLAGVAGYVLIARVPSILRFQFHSWDCACGSHACVRRC